MYTAYYASCAEVVAVALPCSDVQLDAYSELSLSLFYLGQYEQCLQCIDTLLGLKWLPKYGIDLFLRKIRCLQITGDSLQARSVYDETVSFIQRMYSDQIQEKYKNRLDSFMNSTYVASNCLTEDEINEMWRTFSIPALASSAISLTISDDDKKSRFEAMTDILPATIIVKEVPYAVIPSFSTSESRYKSCWECCEQLTNCIPWHYCTLVVFCSVNCKEKAWNDYHQIECQILAWALYELSKLDHYTVGVFMFGFRSFIRAMTAFKSMEKLLEAVKQCK